MEEDKEKTKEETKAKDEDADITEGQAKTKDSDDVLKGFNIKEEIVQVGDKNDAKTSTDDEGDDYVGFERIQDDEVSLDLEGIFAERKSSPVTQL